MDSSLSHDPHAPDLQVYFRAGRWLRAGATPEELDELAAVYEQLPKNERYDAARWIDHVSDNQLADLLAQHRAGADLDLSGDAESDDEEPEESEDPGVEAADAATAATDRLPARTTPSADELADKGLDGPKTDEVDKDLTGEGEEGDELHGSSDTDEADGHEPPADEPGKPLEDGGEPPAADPAVDPDPEVTPPPAGTPSA